ncbi:DUF4232 domain-containing protein [Streptomyces sp. NPDC047981]|uniref:DUF4232 domain-containing protein n=1 Tax=Streptomyces sp. NPDC047981 TaxID=3154610 RepID=UPI00342DAE20
MSGRLTRTRLLAATTVAVAALALTACGGTDASAVRNEGPATSSTPGSPTAPNSPTASASSTARPTTQPPATRPPAGSATTRAPRKPATGKDGGGESGGGKSGGGESTNPQCGAGTTRTIATPVARPLNHLLITVTNTGKKNCDLLGYPYARFGEAQAVPPVDEATRPQAVVTLAPGESGYAGVRLSAADGSGTHGYTTNSLTVGFRNGTVANPSLAGKGVYVDSSLRVTYWQRSMGEALN